MKGAFDGWVVLDIGDRSLPHAVPLQDLSPHYRFDCPCEPTIEEIYDGLVEVIMHSAFDGRGEVKH